jgi:prephenate dehydrogenase
VLVGVIGTGLIGSSVGLAARAAGCRVTGWDDDPGALAGAVAAGAIGTARGSLLDVLEDAAVVVLAAPLDATVGMLHDWPSGLHAHLVLDVASVKVPIVAAAAGVPNFVAAHPIAGSEQTGPAAARADLFQDRYWAYVPPESADLEARARAFIGLLGARPLAIAAQRHDEILAFTSHLPQVASTALAEMLAGRLEEAFVVELCGSGMRSMTRLASSAWSVWSGILKANARPVAEDLRELAGIMRAIADALDDGDDSAVGIRFSAAAVAAKALAASTETTSRGTG